MVLAYYYQSLSGKIYYKNDISPILVDLGRWLSHMPRYIACVRRTSWRTYECYIYDTANRCVVVHHRNADSIPNGLLTLYLKINPLHLL